MPRSVFRRIKESKVEIEILDESSEDEEDESEELIHWRQSPKDSFSDWTVFVRSRKKDGTVKVDTYHVHRVHLATKPRVCSYFTGICQSETFEEGITQTSTFDVEEGVAQAFPDFLDYIYTGKLFVKPSLVAPLRWLAKYLGNDCLPRRLNEGYHPRVGEMLRLYHDAKALHDEEYYDVLAVNLQSSLSVSVLSLKKVEDLFDDAFVCDIFPKLKPNLVASPNERCKKELTAFYKNARLILKTHVTDRPKRISMWSDLTSEEKLPEITFPELALCLLLCESRLTINALGSTLTSLQQRCLDVLESAVVEKVEGCGFCVMDEFEKLLARNHSNELALRLFRMTREMAGRQDDSYESHAGAKRRRFQRAHV